MYRERQATLEHIGAFTEGVNGGEAAHACTHHCNRSFGANRRHDMRHDAVAHFAEIPIPLQSRDIEPIGNLWIHCNTFDEQFFRSKFMTTLVWVQRRTAVPHPHHRRRLHTNTTRSNNGSSSGLPRLAMRGRTIIEEVLPVMRDDHSAGSSTWNPHIDPAIADSHAANGLTNSTHVKLVLEKTSRAMRHATPTEGSVMRRQLNATSYNRNVRQTSFPDDD